MCNGRVRMCGTLGNSTVGNGTVESHWIRIKGQTINLDVIVEVYYRPLGQDNGTDELFFEKLREPSRLTVFSLWGTSACQNLTGTITQLVQPEPDDSLKTWMKTLQNKS